MWPDLSASTRRSRRSGEGRLYRALIVRFARRGLDWHPDNLYEATASYRFFVWDDVNALASRVIIAAAILALACGQSNQSTSAAETASSPKSREALAKMGACAETTVTKISDT